MREIRSPLDGIPSPFAARAIDAYLVGVYRPKVVADFAGIYSANEYYRTGGSASTFSNMFTHARASNATMVDSDGKLKWAPHNLALNSEDLDGASWGLINANTITSGQSDPDGGTSADLIVPSSSGWYRGNNISHPPGASVTIQAYVKSGSGSDELFRLFGNGGSSVSANKTATTTWQLFNYTYIAAGATGWAGFYDSLPGTTSTIIVAFTRVYRSDLGGMVNNPDRGDSYVPTTSSIVYLPRRNHYGWNGSSYVNKGLLLETEARTNLITSSDDMTTWTNTNTTDAKTQTGADGVSNSATLITATAGNGTILTTITAASADYVFSALVKRITGTGTVEMTIDGTNWVDVTSDINTSQYVQVGTGAGANTTNPQVGFRLVTSGDEIAVQVNQLEATSGQFSSPMPTTGTTFIRALETLTIPAAKMAWPTPNYLTENLVTDPTAPTLIGDGSNTWTDNGDGTWTFTVGNAGQVRPGVMFPGPGTGRLAQYAANVTAISGLSVLRVASFSGGLAVFGAATTYSFISSSTGDNGQFQILVETASSTAGSTFTVDISSISVREIDPLSVSLQMQGELTYADEGGISARFVDWVKDSSNGIIQYLDTTSTAVGQAIFYQEAYNVTDSVASASGAYTPGVNVPFNIAGRHGSTFINGAVDGTALTANTTPTALPDLSTTDFSLGLDYMGTIALFREDNNDWGDAGIAEAST